MLLTSAASRAILLLAVLESDFPEPAAFAGVASDFPDLPAFFIGSISYRIFLPFAAVAM